MEKDAKEAAGENTRKLDEKIASLNRELLKIDSTADLASSALEEYRERCDHSYESVDHFTTRNMKLRRELGYLGSAFMHVGKRFKQFAAFAIAATGVKLLIDSVQDFIETVSEFDQALFSIQAILDTTAAKVAVMGKVIRETALDTIYSATEIGEGLRTIGQAGFAMEESLMVLKGVTRLATATMAEFDEVVELSTTALRAFDMEAVRGTETADIFTNAINNAKTTIEKLKTAFNYIGTAGAQAGLSLNEVTGTLMLLHDAGLKASTSATGFRRVLLEMLNPSSRLREAMGRLGMSVEDLNPKMVGWVQALKNLVPLLWDANTNTVDMGKAAEYFQQRAANAISVLVNAVASGSTLETAIKQTEEFGSSLRAAAIQSQGLANVIKRLMDSIENLLIALGDAGFTAIIKAVAESLRWAAIRAAEFAEWVPQLLQFALVTAVLATLAKSFLLMEKYLWKFKRKWDILLFSLKTPVTAAVLAVGALITVIANLQSANSRAAKEAAKSAEEHRKLADETESWGKALTKAMKEGGTSFADIVKRMRQDNPQLVRMLEKELEVAVLESVNSFERLEAAYKAIQELELEKTLKDHAESLAAANRELSKPFTKQFNEALKTLKSETAGFTEKLMALETFIKKARFNIFNASELDLTENIKGNIEAIKLHMKGLFDKKELGSAGDAMRYLNELFEGTDFAKSDKFNELKMQIISMIKEMRGAAEATKEVFQTAIEPLAPEIKKQLLSLTKFQKVEFLRELESVEKDVVDFEQELVRAELYGQKQRTDIVRDYRNQRVREALLEHKDTLSMVERRYGQVREAVKDHYDNLREVIGAFYDWELQLLEGEDIEARLLQSRGQVLQEWERLLGYTLFRAGTLERDYMSVVDDIQDDLLALREKAQQEELSIREHVLEVERLRKDELVKIAEEEGEARRDAVKRWTQDELSRIGYNEDAMKDIYIQRADMLVEIDKETLDRREDLLNEWLSTLRNAYGEAIDKEREYTQAIKDAQDEIADIRKQAVESVRENVDATNEAIRAINRAGMSERELSMDKMREAEKKMSEGFQLLQSNTTENIALSQQFFESARDIYREFGIAAAKGEETAMSETQALLKVKQAGEMVRRAIEDRTDLLVEEQRAQMEAAVAARQSWTDWAEYLHQQIEVVMDELAQVKEFDIGQKYYEIISNAEQEIRDLEQIEDFNISDKHYEIVRHEKVIRQVLDRMGKTTPEPYEAPPIQDFYRGYATGGRVSSSKPSRKGEDNVPAMLSAGEFVIQQGAVKKYGLAFMDALNTGRLMISKFSKGGLAKLKELPNLQIPKFRKGGLVKDAARRVTRAIPKFVNVQKFAGGGVVADIEKEPVAALIAAIANMRDVIHGELRYIGNSILDVVDVGNFGADLPTLNIPELGAMTELLSSVAASTELNNQIGVAGNNYLGSIEKGILQLITAVNGIPAGAININNYQGNARDLAFKIQQLQRSGQAPRLG